ncbi:MAG: SGNH/GDSL hydrolase family protein [Christensenellales bacterium]|jgi:lysophospholipase L1-like esterase
MKTILCYGDSNTWGRDPITKERFAPNERWGGILREIMGSGFFVIEEGLIGRTTIWDDPVGHRNGEKYLYPCLESHRPIDLVIIMLGLNELKKQFCLTAYDISAGMEKLLKIIIGSGAGPKGGSPKILLLSPPHVGKTTGDYIAMFEDAQEKSTKLAAYYQKLAQKFGCRFLDPMTLVSAADLADGIHFDPSQHHILAQSVAKIAREMLEK